VTASASLALDHPGRDRRSSADGGHHGAEDGTLFPVGFATTFTATAVDASEGDLAAGLKWTSDRDGLIGTGRSVITSSLTPGRPPHHRRGAEREGTLGSAMITAFIGSAPPQVSITAPADGGTIFEGTPSRSSARRAISRTATSVAISPGPRIGRGRSARAPCCRSR
jgi:hypothetical protein